MQHVGCRARQQLDFRIQQLGHVHREEVRAQQSQIIQALQRTATVAGDGVGHLAGGFMHVHVDRHVQFIAQHLDSPQRRVGHRVGACGAKAMRTSG